MTPRLLTPLLAAVLAIACSSTTDMPGSAGITIVAGTWNYTLSENIPLPAGTTTSCKASGSGTVAVAADGSYSIAFPMLACSGCSMTASTAGRIAATSVTGTVSASIAGSGCSNQQPTPNPAAVTGSCTATSCTALTADSASFAVMYTLTPPG